MLKIQDNSRQIPNVKQYTSHGLYHDLLYGYLQSISHWDGVVGHKRYVWKNAINFSQIAKIIGVSRQTVSKKFHFLLNGDQNMPPLLQLNQDGTRYQLINLQKSIAMLVAEDTLELLLNTLKQDVISVYVYLLNRYIASFENSFQFTIPELRLVTGYKPGNRHNDKFRHILFVLQKIGLLKYELRDEFDQSEGIKKCYYVTWMTNHVDIQMPC